jgi:hypothetical protein
MSNNININIDQRIDSIINDLYTLIRPHHLISLGKTELIEDQLEELRTLCKDAQESADRNRIQAELYRNTIHRVGE